MIFCCLGDQISNDCNQVLVWVISELLCVVFVLFVVISVCFFVLVFIQGFFFLQVVDYILFYLLKLFLQQIFLGNFFDSFLYLLRFMQYIFWQCGFLFSYGSLVMFLFGNFFDSLFCFVIWQVRFVFCYFMDNFICVVFCFMMDGFFSLLLCQYFCCDWFVIFGFWLDIVVWDIFLYVIIGDGIGILWMIFIGDFYYYIVVRIIMGNLDIILYIISQQVFFVMVVLQGYELCIFVVFYLFFIIEFLQFVFVICGQWVQLDIC